jgi:UDP-glucose 4-epimerase
MRIFMTGATGFIGRRLLPLLQGHDVLCLTRTAERLDALPFARPLKGNLRHIQDWRHELDSFDPECCMHLAWEGLPDYSPKQCRLNLEASLRLVDALTGPSFMRIVVAGSCWEYGVAKNAVRENDTPIDCGVFAVTKNELAARIKSAAAERDFAFSWARIFFAYGPGQRETSLIPQCHAAYRAGKTPEIRNPTTVQDFIFVGDAARGLLALTQPNVASGIYNLGTGRPTAVAEVVNLVAAYYGKSQPYKDIEPGEGFWSSREKMAAATGWQARTSLQDGLAKTLLALDGQHP